MFTGIVGGTYGIGIPIVAHWLQASSGLAMSIYGAGSIGTTLNKMLAPLLIALSSWVIVPQVYACLVLVAALLFWLFSYQNTDHITTSKVTLREQIGTLKDKIVLCYCHYYSISFGAFVALSLWMVQYYKDEFSLSLEQAAFLTAVLPSRPVCLEYWVGGSDKV
ncbi:MAG: hypothetical protein IPK86_04400 [Neisseriales bacterium]|nr:MAG: hypothetical protein IPK86_04400 [Neisseriales bacterium]